MRKVLENQIKSLPNKPGVYLFKNRLKKIIYIGKAKKLKKRVLSYFFKNKASVIFVNKIFSLDFILTKNEKDALLLENELIKKYLPRYNVELKDDKNYFFLGISKETWPRVFLTHQPQRREAKFLGPFPKGKELKKYLEELRKAFPYRSCLRLPKKPCLYFDLKLCPGFCLQEIKNNKKSNYNVALKSLKVFLNIYLLNSPRIEIYDISHISGHLIVGSMAVFKKNKPKKSEYRRFRIKTVKAQNDPLSLVEILSRRLKHNEWPKPSLIVLDGGKPQLNSVLKITGPTKIPIVAIAKDKKFGDKIYSPFSLSPIFLKNLPEEVKNFFIFARDESHRFAISYHRLRRKKTL